MDGSEPGDYVKRGQSPKAWRVGRGMFRLIVDPADDTNAQDRELARALQLAKLGHRRTTPKSESGWSWTQGQMEFVLGRLKAVETALDRYDYLQCSLRSCNVATSPDYRIAFIGYYGMGWRRRMWYDRLFSILERDKRGGTASFRAVLEEIRGR